MKFFLGDANSFIPYLKIITVLHVPSCDLHGLPLLGGFDGIIGQIDQNSLQQVLLGIEFSLFPADVNLHPAVFWVLGLIIDFLQIRENTGDICGLTIDLLTSGHNDVQQSECHSLQAFSLCINIIGTEKMLLLVQFAGTQHIRVTDYSCQRCLQFMGKCGNKIFSGSDFIFQILNILLQCFCHMVEIRSQLSHFIITDLLRAIAVFSLRHFAGSLRQKPDRSGQPAGDQRHYSATAQQYDHRHLTIHPKSFRPLRIYRSYIFHGL